VKWTQTARAAAVRRRRALGAAATLATVATAAIEGGWGLQVTLYIADSRQGTTRQGLP
jgi:hypothetical protein